MTVIRALVNLHLSLRTLRCAPSHSLFDTLHTVENLRNCALLVSLGRDRNLFSPVMGHPKNHERTEEEWRELAREANKEEDPDKLLDLAEQIVEKYKEEKRKNSPPHDWKQLYELALIELETGELPQRISAARNAMLNRIKKNSTKPYDQHEHQELRDAVNTLRFLQQDYERRVQR